MKSEEFIKDKEVKEEQEVDKKVDMKKLKQDVEKGNKSK